MSIATDLRANLRHGLVNVTAHRPFLAAAANEVNEVADDFPAARCMGHFRMELQSVGLQGPILDRCVIRIFRAGHRSKPEGKFGQVISMGIPHLDFSGQVFEKAARSICNRQCAFAKFPSLAALNFPRQEVREQLHPIADPQDRQA
jgi:hypothetical protein